MNISIYLCTHKQTTTLMTTTLTLTTPKGKRIVMKAPSNAIAIANMTEGDNSPCPCDDVQEELYHFRLQLGRVNLHTKVISVQATEFCTINYIVLKEDTIENRIRAVDMAIDFCRRADYLYTTKH